MKQSVNGTTLLFFDFTHGVIPAFDLPVPYGNAKRTGPAIELQAALFLILAISGFLTCERATDEVSSETYKA